MDLLLWLDQDPHRYWFVAYVLLYATIAIALAPEVSRRVRPSAGERRTDAALLVLGALTLLAFHWPSYYWEWSSNPDEAQMLAQAIKSAHAPIPWSAYDPTTSGPLNTLVLALPALFGVVPGYVSARIEGTFLVFGSLVFFYLAMRSLFDKTVARLATLPVFVFFAVCESTDFNGYASELTPVFLVTYLLLCVAKAPATRPSRLGALAVLAGLTAGAVPFAKLQLTPLAALEAVVLICIVAVRTDLPRALKRAAFGAFGASAIAVPAIILVPVTASGAFGDFVTSYLITPIEKLGHRTDVFSAMFGNAPDFRAFFTASYVALTACAAALLVISRRGAVRSRDGAALAAGMGLLIGALYAIYQPHRDFTHYLLIAAFPLAAPTGVALGALIEAARDRVPQRFQAQVIAALALGFAVATCVPTLAAAAAERNVYAGRLATALADRDADVPPLVASRIVPGSSLAVWGWMPQYYVRTRTIMATRDSITQPQIFENSRRDYYRARYMRDLEAANPRYFIDAVAPGSFAYQDPKTQGHETFAALRHYITANYHLVGVSKGVRLFERNGALRSARPLRR